MFLLLGRGGKGASDCFMNLHVLIPFHAENCSLNWHSHFAKCWVLWRPTLLVAERERVSVLHAFSPSVGYARSRFCYFWGTYLSGISYAVNGLAWGRFGIIYLFFVFFLVTRAFCWHRITIDGWSRSTLALQLRLRRFSFITLGKASSPQCEGIMCREQAFSSLSIIIMPSHQCLSPYNIGYKSLLRFFFSFF
jgi:hypothetical protein